MQLISDSATVIRASLYRSFCNNWQTWFDFENKSGKIQIYFNTKKEEQEREKEPQTVRALLNITCFFVKVLYEKMNSV